VKRQFPLVLLTLALLVVTALAACQSNLEPGVTPTPGDLIPATLLTVTIQQLTPTATMPELIPATTAAATPIAEIREATATKFAPTVTARPPSPTSSLEPTQVPTLLPFQPASANPAFVGEAVPTPIEPITAANYTNLRLVAQWGRGNILGVAFTPDGHSFVVGSEFGLAVYDREAPGTPPQWIPLDPPFYYESLYFDSTGAYLLLDGRQSEQVYTFPGGHPQPNSIPAVWLRSTALSGGWGDLQVVTADRQKRLVSYADYVDDTMIEESVRQVVDVPTGELLYKLGDATFYAEYDDWNEPEGCDLFTFSMCGNAFDPSAMHPYRAGFSPAGDYLAILYRPPNLWNSGQFSTLRVYDAHDGRLLHVIGSFNVPVATFAFSPDGNTLLVGYQSGAADLWDMPSGTDIFSAWHFNAPLVDLELSPDGNYLVLQRPDWVEVRLTNDGSLLGRYRASAFAISPLGDVIALGDREGNLTLKTLAGLQDIHRIQAHDGPIFALAFSPDGQTVVSSGQDCAVKSWDAVTAAYLHDLAENMTNAYGYEDTASRIFVYFLRFLPGSSQVMGYGSWSRVVSWDATSGATRYLIEPEPLAYYEGMITLDPHFPEFMSVDVASGQLFVGSATYDLATGERTGEYQPPENLPAGCAAAGPLTANGELRFTLGYDSREGQICLLNAADNSLLDSIQISPSSGQTTTRIAWLYLSPQGDQLIVTTGSGVVLVYQVDSD
jgi:WD40 repeat protein